MSYTRRYSEVVSKTVSKTVTVNYPASQNGGSKSVTVDILAEIPVDVNIHVDTIPFDRSIEKCTTNVDLLTASVVATEAAEIISKQKNSIKVADTVIGGFFGYIRSEISQQVSELTQQINSHLMHLKELASACLSKKNQMEGDFNRISSRYTNIFNDLNQEISNRITQLDKPVFIFSSEMKEEQSRLSENDMSNIATVFHSDNGMLQSKIGSSHVKKSAYNTILKARRFLLQQKNLQTTLRESIVDINLGPSILLPICYFEASQAANHKAVKIFGDQNLRLEDNQVYNRVADGFEQKSGNWVAISREESENLTMYFNTELSNFQSREGSSGERVLKTIRKIADLSTIKTIRS